MLQEKKLIFHPKAPVIQTHCNCIYDGMLPGPFENSQDFQGANASIMQTFDIRITIKVCSDWNILPSNHTQVIVIHTLHKINL